LDAAPRRAVSVRMVPSGEAGESSSRWAATSPLARISPARLPALPALPAPSASAPSSSSARWLAPPAAGAGPAEAAGRPSGTLPDRPGATPRAAAQREDAPPAPADVTRRDTFWLSPQERAPWSSGVRAADSAAPGPIPDSAAEPTHAFGDQGNLPLADAPKEPPDEYDTFVVEDGEVSSVVTSTGETVAEPAPADEVSERDTSRDATRLLADRAAPEPGAPDQLGPTTLLRLREAGADPEPGASPAASWPDDDPGARRVLASIDDLPPTRRLDERAVEGPPRLRGDAPPPDGAPTTDAPSTPEDGVAAEAQPAAAPPTHPPQEVEEGAAAVASAQPRPYTRISRKYVVRRMPRHIGHRRGRPRQ
jgi:hypothetical protein